MAIKLLLVSFPLQRHLNHLVGLGKSLAARGASIIFTTTETDGKNMRIANNIVDRKNDKEYTDMILTLC